MTEPSDFLKPPEMQCVNCWHRWKPEHHFRDTPRCPECGSTWLVRVDYLNLALRLSQREEELKEGVSMTTSKETTIPAKPMELCKGCGYYAWRWRDYPPPGKWVCDYCFRIDGIKEQMELGCLDPELYDVLLALTRRGFYTCSSCAGHRKGACGGISFCRQEIKGRDMEDLLWILQRYGLKDIELKTEGRYTTGVSFAAIEGSQYDRLIDNSDRGPEDWDDVDYCHSIPPRPEKCPACGESVLWLQGEPYNIEDTMEWMCKQCQPKPFNAGMACMTPEIAKRRKELPKLKLWEVEDEGKKMPFRIRAENESSIYEQLGKDPYENDDDWLFITRIE